MRFDATDVFLFLGFASAVIGLGSVLLRASRTRVLGWTLLGSGLAVVALLALAQLTGRLGPDLLWFRAPTFYLAALILLGALVWWLSRPAPRALRFGLPALLLTLLGT